MKLSPKALKNEFKQTSQNTEPRANSERKDKRQREKTQDVRHSTKAESQKKTEKTGWI